MSLQRWPLSREEQLGQKMQWCSSIEQTTSCSVGEFCAESSICIVRPAYSEARLCIKHFCESSIIGNNKGTRRENMSVRSASAVWKGTLKEGKGTISTESGVLKDAQYSFSSRFEEGIGSNPEELIAAAHAGCFSMALSAQLTGANLPPESIETTAAVTLEKTDAGPTVTKIHLTTKAKVPGADKAKFDELAGNAKKGCPISRLLAAAEITLDASLV